MIGYGAFFDCFQLSNVSITGSSLIIGECAFENCTLLRTLSLKGVKEIGKRAFNGCICLNSVSITSGTTVIGQNAFLNCTYLSNLTFGYGVETIGAYAFSECVYLEAISVPGSVKTIGSYAFNGCERVKSITLGYGIEDINSYAFANCDNVKTLVIMSSVTYLGAYAFQSMDKIDTICLSEQLYNGYHESSIFTGTEPSTWVTLQPNPFTASGKTATVKAKKVKKKAQTVAASKLYKLSPSTGILAAKVYGNKNFTVNKANGNITVKKKTKKGTYKIKVRIMSTGNAEYEASDWTMVTIKIKVK